MFHMISNTLDSHLTLLRTNFEGTATSLFGNMIVDTGEILVITKEYQIQIIILMLQQGPCLDHLCNF